MKREKAEQYMLALQFFSDVLLNPPDEALLRHIVDEGLFERFSAWECFRPGGEGEVCESDPAKVLRHLQKTCSVRRGGEGKEAVDRLLEELYDDHRALLSGPAPRARPWESLWKERSATPHRAPKEKLRQWYHDWGVATARDDLIAEDQLGRELAFALHLLRLTVEDPQAVSSWKQPPRAALADFMDQHLLPWAGPCLRKVYEEASTVFFRELPKLCCVMLENLRRDVAGE